jgi:hypothetical protein
VDSANHHLWKYDGQVEADGKRLVLATEGPCPFRDNKLTKFREVMELKSPDHRVFTSSYQEDDGKWTTIVNVNSKRKDEHADH